jgi:hypothetical protein
MLRHLSQLIRDAHRRWPVQACAVDVEWRPVHRLVTRAAGRRSVPAAVTETRLTTDQDLVGAEGMPVGAASRWVGDPLPRRGLHQLAEHV